jgi:NADH dehydrogenase FAD-containing subunit
VEPDLSLPGDPEGFVVGDQTHEIGEQGSSLPAVAPVAM